MLFGCWNQTLLAPRGIWPLGVIEEVLHSNDGVPRSFRVGTQKGNANKLTFKLSKRKLKLWKQFFKSADSYVPAKWVD